LAAGAAAPTGKHNPSAQVVNLHDKLFLVDCGEGTQMQLRKFKVKMQRINHVFISHLHGDHYLGLMGFISSMHLLGRKTKLVVYGHEDLKGIIDIQLKASQTFLDYEVEFIATSQLEKQLIYEDKSLQVYSFPLKHRIETCGFQFMEKARKPKVKKEDIEKFRLQPSQIVDLKNGKSIILDNGSELASTDVCTPANEPRSYAYCSDTAYSEKVINYISESSCIYHESTFLESEKERAKTTFHSTASQAATVAKRAQVGMLILGHYSSRYSDDSEFLKEASAIFENAYLADEGVTFQVGSFFPHAEDDESDHEL
jgi:ribonuclease Z